MADEGFELESPQRWSATSPTPTTGVQATRFISEETPVRQLDLIADLPCPPAKYCIRPLPSEQKQLRSGASRRPVPASTKRGKESPDRCTPPLQEPATIQPHGRRVWPLSAAVEKPERLGGRINTRRAVARVGRRISYISRTAAKDRSLRKPRAMPMPATSFPHLGCLPGHAVTGQEVASPPAAGCR